MLIGELEMLLISPPSVMRRACGGMVPVPAPPLFSRTSVIRIGLPGKVAVAARFEVPPEQMAAGVAEALAMMLLVALGWNVLGVVGGVVTLFTSVATRPALGLEPIFGVAA